MALLTEEEVRKYAALYSRTWEVSFFDSVVDCINKAVLYGLRIKFDTRSKSSYYNSGERLIVIGLKNIEKLFNLVSKEQLFKAVEFLRLHETGHLRFTSQEPYEWGIKRGCEIVIEYIVTREGLHMRFRKAADYDYAIEELAKKGVFVKKDSLFELIASLLNILCDGRIERILAIAYYNFAELCGYFNLQMWKTGPCTAKKGCLTAQKRLTLFVNNILFLAIVQLYQKDFLFEFSGTDEEAFLKSLMPYIYKGITAGTTREMVESAAMPIITELAPYIYDAIKENKADPFKEALENALKLALESGFIGVNENDAEEDDSGYQPLLPMSDLEVTLSDEKYDELVEKLKNKGQSENGLKIKREHPKPKEESEDKKDSLESGGGTGARTEESSESASESGLSESGSKDGAEETSEFSKNSGAIGNRIEEDSKDSSESGSEGIDSNESGGEGFDSKAENRNCSGGEESEDSSMSQAKNPSNDSENGNKEDSGAKSSGNDLTGDKPKGQNGRTQKNKDSIEELNRGANDSESLDSVLQEMEEAAAKRLETDARTSINSIEDAIRAEASCNRFKPVSTPFRPLTKEDVKDICDVKFQEVPRRFKLTDRPPADIEAKGRKANREYQLFMQNRKKPTKRMRTEGTIDARSIWRLAANKIDVFKKDGKVVGFDGCTYILLDNSGSMSGIKKMLACRALAVQEIAFDKLFPFKIVAFDQCGMVFHEVLKDWNESQPYSSAWNFALHGRNGCDNSDEHDIRIATKELMNRPERKKLLIVLSDGAPDDVEDTKRAIAEARKKGVTVVGIYFEEGEIDMEYCDFPYMYEKDFVLCAVNEIEKNLSAILEKFFKS